MSRRKPEAGPVLLWLRQDLRLTDNPALVAAAKTGRPVLPVFVLDESAAAPWAPGGAGRWWLHHSLAALCAGLDRLGSNLILRHGATVDVLCEIADRSAATAIHFTRCYEPAAAALELALKTACEKAGLGIHRYGGSLINEPEAIRTKAGDPFRVFTPFWRTMREASPQRAPLAAPKRLVAPATWPKSDRLDDWKLRPAKPDWAGGLRDTWQPGEAGAAKRLASLLDQVLTDYSASRDRPDLTGTSMLSPHLHFGEIGPHQIWHAVEAARQRDPRLERGAETYLREIGWREFSYHLLHHWPHIADSPFRPEFAAFPWAGGKAQTRKDLAAWQRGRTGYPIVDAGMRQLWHTGWMHNRVRMIAASFLTKHLLIPWQEGARWFWDTLVDADLASNSASWQWVAGSGADAAPYFRIFNPVLQAQKFDARGDYVRRYVPELAKLPDAHIHAPWQAPPDVLIRAGVRLGKDYPLPLADHAAARARALEAYRTLRAQ